jgi:CRISPR-associated protein Cmr2
MTTLRPDRFWLDLCRAFLHDPPDKALDIPGHERRAVRYQAAILGRGINDARNGEGSLSGDVLASAVERLPLPDWELTKDQTTIPKRDLQRVHPVTGADIPLSNAALAMDEDATEALLQDLARAWPEPRLRYLALWRLLPGLIGDQQHLPADTRLRDHSIIDHLDVCAAYAGALWREDGKGSRHHESALLSLSIGPVQGQIAAARSTRDLWCGSWLISWLTFQGLLVLVERLGPQSVIFPALRGNPLMDAWLMQQGLGTAEESRHAVRVLGRDTLTAALPNTGLALVPAHEAETLAEAIRTRIQSTWAEMGGQVKQRLVHIIGEASWAEGWEAQISQVWDVRVAVLPSAPRQVKGYDQEARKRYTDLMGGDPGWSVKAAGRLVEYIQSKGHLPSYGAAPGLWMIESELAAKALGMQKQIRTVPAPEHDARPKCSLYGSWAAMGPSPQGHGGMRTFQKFWSDCAEIDFGGHHLAGWIRQGECLSAVALTKRFAWSCAIQPTLSRWIGEDIRETIPDTRQVATAWWRAQVTSAAAPAWSQWCTDVEHFGSVFVEDDRTALLFACNTSEAKLEVSSPVLRQAAKAMAGQRQAVVKAARELKRPLLGAPRGYYAVLVADGDNMGAWLRGQKGMTLKDAYHPGLQRYFGDAVFASHGGAPVARRPLTPASQAAFSACLTGFAAAVRRLFASPDKGHLIYAGGDDVLALLPVEQALPTAEALRGLWEQALPGATISMGLAMVHHHLDLRAAIQAARDAETYAKTHGRNACAFSVVRRHGDQTTALLPWGASGPDGIVLRSQRVAEHLWNSSDRWVHRLLAEQETLSHLAGDPATEGMIGQRLKAVLAHGDNSAEVKGAILEVWATLKTAWHGRIEPVKQLPEFLALMQNLSFIARDLET